MSDGGHGHDPGHAAGLRWDEYVAWLVAAHGSLAAVAERLADHHARQWNKGRRGPPDAAKAEALCLALDDEALSASLRTRAAVGPPLRCSRR